MRLHQIVFNGMQEFYLNVVFVVVVDSDKAEVKLVGQPFVARRVIQFLGWDFKVSVNLHVYTACNA